MPVNEEVFLNSEKALEPDLPICDAHQHIWNFERNRYLVADFVKDASGGHNITQSVAVQSRGNYDQVPGGGMTPVEETRFVMRQIDGLKSKIDVAAGFVGYVDLATGQEVQALLEAHLEVGKKIFKGIRYPFAPLYDPERFSNPKVHEGFAFLPKYKLIYEITIGVPKFPDLVDMAKKFPDTPIIIDNLGWPKSPATTHEEHDEMIAVWRRSIQRVAIMSNIYIKTGGTSRFFGFEKKSKPPTSEEIVKTCGNYYQFVFEQFGPKRCMFVSNFPTDKEASSYNVIWNAFKLMTRSFTKTERAYLFHDTANQVYSL